MNDKEYEIGKRAGLFWGGAHSRLHFIGTTRFSRKNVTSPRQILKVTGKSR